MEKKEIRNKVIEIINKMTDKDIEYVISNMYEDGSEKDEVYEEIKDLFNKVFC